MGRERHTWLITGGTVIGFSTGCVKPDLSNIIILDSCEKKLFMMNEN
jgi:hypothetical protein